MKIKTTLVLVGVFAALLAVVLFFDSKGEKAKAAEEKTNTLISPLRRRPPEGRDSSGPASALAFEGTRPGPGG
ncbi:MAG: hypothetical protein MZU95_02055 [Desulfomicrobium escambiense]|nr:hypothetical protein [Desulfomicrobium escambiense]